MAPDPRMRLVEAIADVAHDAAVQFVRQRVRGAGHTADSGPVTVLQTASEDPSPFCTVGRHVAAARLYLSRGQTAKAYWEPYKRLASESFGEALLTLYRLPPSQSTRELIQQIENLDAKLQYAMDDVQADLVLRMTRSVAFSALSYAEAQGTV